MPLPWIRLDSSIADHDKVLGLLSDPSPKRWQAMSSYIFALGWSGKQGTDGRVPAAALPFIHATNTTARLLVKHGLWHENSTGTGWTIHNYAEYQQTEMVTEAKQTQFKVAGQKAACARWHGINCWKNGACSKPD